MFSSHSATSFILYWHKKSQLSFIKHLNLHRSFFPGFISRGRRDGAVLCTTLCSLSFFYGLIFSLIDFSFCTHSFGVSQRCRRFRRPVNPDKETERTSLCDIYRAVFTAAYPVFALLLLFLTSSCHRLANWMVTFTCHA